LIRFSPCPFLYFLCGQFFLCRCAHYFISFFLSQRVSLSTLFCPLLPVSPAISVPPLCWMDRIRRPGFPLFFFVVDYFHACGLGIFFFFPLSRAHCHRPSAAFIIDGCFAPTAFFSPPPDSLPPALIPSSVRGSSLRRCCFEPSRRSCSTFFHIFFFFSSSTGALALKAPLFFVLIKELSSPFIRGPPIV